MMEVEGKDLLQRNGPLVVLDRPRSAPQSGQPLFDVLRIIDAATEEEKLSGGRRLGDGQFVV